MRRPRKVFGFLPNDRDLRAVADAVLAPAAGVRLVVTPNLDHVARLRDDASFQAAYRRSAMVLCDGFPVHAYARLHAQRSRHVTGCDLTAALMGSPPPASEARWFFVVDEARTASAVQAWAERTMRGRVEVAVPPLGFIADEAACLALARRIAAHGTTLLLMGVGAPQSEVFVDRERANLPPCWAICVGQAIKVTLGLVRRAPRPLRALHLEWLWRVAQEPRRLGARYARGSLGFLLAVAEDLFAPEQGGHAAEAGGGAG